MQRILTAVSIAIATAEATELLSNFKMPKEGDTDLVSNCQTTESAVKTKKLTIPAD